MWCLHCTGNPTAQLLSASSRLCKGMPMCEVVRKCSQCISSCELHNSRTGLQGIAVGFGVFYVVAILNCVTHITERAASLEGRHAEPQPLVPNLMRTVRNRPFRLLVAAWAIDWVMVSLVGTMLPFWVQYVLCPIGSTCADKHAVWVGIMFLCLLFTQVASMPVWLALTHRFGKRNTWVVYNLLNCMTTPMYVFCSEGQTIIATIFTVFNGIPLGGQFLIESILSDVIDYEEFLTGRRIEGAFTVFQTFLPKISSIPAQTLPLALLSVVGFVSSDHGQRRQQPTNVKFFVTFLFSAMPSALALVSFFIKLYFPIKTRDTVEKIGAGIAAHQDQRTAQDPVTGSDIKLPQDVDTETQKQFSLFDTFSTKIVELITSNDQPTVLIVFRRLRVKLAAYVVVSVSLVVVMFSVVMFSLRAELLATKSWSWVPTLCMIACGVSLTSVVFNVSRLLTARKLQKLSMKGTLVRRSLLLETTTETGRAVNEYLAHRRTIEAPLRLRKNKVHPERPDEAVLADDQSDGLVGGNNSKYKVSS